MIMGFFENFDNGFLNKYIILKIRKKYIDILLCDFICRNRHLELFMCVM
jgi:hypothetical protein